MAVLANVSIDVSKIDKSKLITGKKGTYLNLTVSINDEKDNYDNDVSAWQSQTKEERESKTPKTFLGNGRKIWEGVNQSKPKPRDFTPENPDNYDEEGHDDLPF